MLGEEGTRTSRLSLEADLKLVLRSHPRHVISFSYRSKGRSADLADLRFQLFLRSSLREGCCVQGVLQRLEL